jgi:predicted transcriptional regulator YheO
VTSVSVVLHNAKGAPRGLLCINLDRSPFDGMIDQLVRFAAPVEDRPAELFDKDWREQILLVVDEECRSRRLRRDRLTREQRLELVRVLDERGLFATRNAAAHAGAALGISRTTVYALLKEARS